MNEIYILGRLTPDGKSVGKMLEYEVYDGIYQEKVFHNIEEARDAVKLLEPDELRPVVVFKSVEAYKAHAPVVYEINIEETKDDKPLEK